MDRTTGAPDTRHPILAAALRALGEDPDGIMGNNVWDSGLLQTFADEGLPTVLCGRNAVSVTIRPPHRGWRITFRVREDMRERPPRLWRHHVEMPREALPDTVTALLVGRTLGDVVAFPGGEGLEIQSVEDEDGLVVLVLRAPDPVRTGAAG